VTRAVGNEAANRNGHGVKKGNRYEWESTNKLLGCFDGLYGCKTGITRPAGACFAGYYEKNGLKLALVLLSSQSMDARWVEIQKMVHWIEKANWLYTDH
jgi:D-alanyl-D-alanine carboxypeptidase